MACHWQAAWNCIAGMSMKSRQLEAFRAVMLTGSVTLGAKMIFVSQPAVSRLIHDLEDRLGFQLFIRLPNKLLPTQEAEAFYLEVERSFIGMTQIKNAAKAIKNKQQGSLKIIVTPLVIDSFMTQLISQFSALYPKVSIELEVAPKVQASQLMRGNQFDFAILPKPAINEEGLSSHVFSKHAAVCVMPKGHPLCAKETVDIQDLNGQKYLCLSAGSPFRTAVDGVFLQYAVEPNRVLETRHQHTIYQLVAQGMGVALLDPLILKKGDDRVCVKPFTPEIVWKYALVHVESRPLSLVAQSFAELLMAHFSPKN